MRSRRLDRLARLVGEGSAFRDTMRATATGYGQMFFAESPRAGVLLLGGMVAFDPIAAAASAGGCAVATLAARHARYPRTAWRRGLYGYAGALFGVLWSWLLPWSLLGGLVFVAAAATMPTLTRLAHRILSPRGLPALGLPALVPISIAVLVLGPAPSVGETPAARVVAGWVLTAIGLALFSRLFAAAALLGAVTGLALSFAVIGRPDLAMLWNAVLAAAALGALFLPWCRASAAVACAGAAGAALLCWSSASTLGVLVLVWPATAVCLVTLALLHVPSLRRLVPGHPLPLPIASVGRPEQGQSLHRAMQRLHVLLARGGRICVLTGAGVSTEAGIPDVRGASGLWIDARGVTFEDFLASPDERARYWQQEERCYRLMRGARPSPTHRALAELDRQGWLTAVVTQNVDGLHQAAGLRERAVVELHGNIHAACCIDCGRTYARAALSERIAARPRSVYCDSCQGIVKGGGVLFGEALDAGRLTAAAGALLSADLLLVLGTSLTVAPAADLVQWAREAGIPIAIVNGSPTPHDAEADVVVTADVGAVMTDLVARLPRRARRDLPISVAQSA